MASGLVALLDDVASLTKLAAASLDDVGAAAGKAGSKAMGVVVDDAAVTPRYVTGLTPDRELPIIGRITLGSLRNKLLLLLPAALILSSFAPWAITPILMIGGAYLCFEGAEKIVEILCGGHEKEASAAPSSLEELEQQQVSGAIRTDLILSAEIMAIALAEVATLPLLERGAVLAAVGVAITIGVYGVVALIVKMDDVGLHLARRPSPTMRALGRGLVKGMPVLMRWLSVLGTAAMIWVGGGILVHGLEVLGWPGPAIIIHHLADRTADALPVAPGLVGWGVNALGAGLVGFALGTLVAWTIRLIPNKSSEPTPHR